MARFVAKTASTTTETSKTTRVNILLELDALLAQIEKLAADGDRDRYDKDDHYRWVLHRLWIAVGNEALAYARLTGRNVQKEQPWARLYRLRNMLAHDRLPDIDEHEVWRMSERRWRRTACTSAWHSSSLATRTVA